MTEHNMPMSNNLRDLIAAALRGDDKWDSLSESQKAVWRADADRVLKALQSAPGYAQGFESCREAIEDIRSLIADLEGEHEFWHGAPPDSSGWKIDVPLKTLKAIAALPAPAGVEVTVEELADWLDRCEALRIVYSPLRDDDECAEIAKALLSRFTILAKPAQEGQGL